MTPSRSKRRAEVLRSVVRAYVATGEPVSSSAVVRTAGLGCSSATVRAVMAELEALGWLVQPHTSAGRVPSEAGFRAYADLVLAELGEHPAGEADGPPIVSDPSDVPAFLSRASRTLAERTGCFGLVLRPRLANTRFRIAHFLRLERGRVVAVLVGAEGVVTDRVVETREDYSQAELDRMSAYLTNRFRGSTLAEVRRTLAHELSAERAAFDAALRRRLTLALDCFERCEGAAGEVYVDASPHGGDGEEGLARLLRAYAEKDRIVELLGRCLEREGVQVLIGSPDAEDADLQAIAGVAVVAVRYGEAGRPLGSVGVLGPTRMRYEEVIPLVHRVARDVGAALSGASAPND